MRELTLNKKHFVIFNEGDRFQLLSSGDGYDNEEEFNAEVDKLFLKYDSIIVTKENYIYGQKGRKRHLIAQVSFKAFHIALEVIDDEGYDDFFYSWTKHINDED